MNYLAHGTGSGQLIIASGELWGGNKQAKMTGEDTGAAKEIFFNHIDSASHEGFFAQLVTARSYAKKPTTPRNARAIFLFDAAVAGLLTTPKGEYQVITAAKQPLAALGLQLAIFIQEDIGAAVPGSNQDPFVAFCINQLRITAGPGQDPNTMLDYHPAVIPLATLNDEALFNTALARIIAEAKSYGFCL